MTPQPTNEQKLTAFRYQFWLLSCQTPKSFWNTPEETEFELARSLTGASVEKTDWAHISADLKNRCPTVWQQAIENAKRSLGISE